MVNVKKDLTGMIFGRLTVLRQVEDHIKPNGKHEAQWECECSCEKHSKILVLGQNLKKENGTKSCGCIRSEMLSEIAKNSKKYNNVELNLTDKYGTYGVGYCSNTNTKFYFDMDDYDSIKDFCWYEHYDKKNNYHSLLARDIEANKPIKMTRILNCVGYDHADRNPFNNRRYNLRPANARENAINHSIRVDNTSGVTGVYFNEGSQKWQSYIYKEKQYVYLGVFESKYDAIKKRLQYEKEIYGDFAPQRHLFDEYGVS